MFKGLPLILSLFLAVPVVTASNTLVEMADTLNQDTSPRIKVYTYGVELIVLPESGEYNFKIYSITGQVVKSLKLGEGSELIELPQGCYIIKCEAWSKKIVIR